MDKVLEYFFFPSFLSECFFAAWMSGLEDKYFHLESA